MKRLLSFGAALTFLSAFAACTMDFDKFQASGGGGPGGGGGGSPCGECCKATDCPEPTAPCMAAACVLGTCGEVARPDGIAVPTQTIGDCVKHVCQGGAVVTTDDDDDPPNDNNDCTEDACNDGKPSTMPAGVGAACNDDGGAVCDGMGACVECLDDGDCGAEESCDTAAHTCVPASCMDRDQNGAETDVDCGGGTCAPCGVGEGCSVGTDCTSGVCGANDTCSAPSCNDGVKNGAETDVDCGEVCPDECGPNQGCNTDDDCEGGDCTGVGGTCVPNCDDEVQNNDETDVDCGGGRCKGCAVGEMCAGDDASCESGNCGPGDVCAPKGSGSPCAQDGECQSNQCEQGVCCQTSCNDACESCALAGSVGTCTPIPSGQDPDNDCPGSAVCDGSGGCKKPQGQSCGGANGTCLAGLFCTDGVCCNQVCSGTCEACDVAGSVGTCVDVPNGQDPDNECPGAATCDGDGACAKLANGVACSNGNECTSNFCVDDVCCNVACAGLCQMCDHPINVGVCTNVPNGQDPDDECAGAATCNGSGMCSQ